MVVLNNGDVNVVSESFDDRIKESDDAIPKFQDRFHPFLTKIEPTVKNSRLKGTEKTSLRIF